MSLKEFDDVHKRIDRLEKMLKWVVLTRLLDEQRGIVSEGGFGDDYSRELDKLYELEKMKKLSDIWDIFPM